MIPSLLYDLLMIYELNRKPKEDNILQISPDERCQGNAEDHCPPRKILLQDLNCLPYPDDMPELQDNEPDEGSSVISEFPENEPDDESLDTADLPDNDLVDGSLPGSVSNIFIIIGTQYQHKII